MYEQPSRQACDRCHDLKLRCHRSDADKCNRCLRAGAACVFSPSNRGRRPTHQNRRQGSQMPGLKKAPPILHKLRQQLGDVDAQSQGSDYPNDDRHLHLQTEHVDDAPIASAEAPGIVPNPCIGFDTQTLRKEFTPSLTFSSAPPGSGAFARYHGESSLSPVITDPDMSFLEPFSGLIMPQLLPTEEGIGFDTPQLQSQQMDPPHGSDAYRKISPQTQFLQHFMKDLLELDIDLIQHTLEDPILFDRTTTTPKTHGTNASLSLSECAIDTTFNLTQRLTKILCRAGNLRAEHSAAQDSYRKSPLSTSSSFSSRFQQAITKETPQGSPGNSDMVSQEHENALDEISLLHALSTYMRLLEAFHITFSQTTEKFGTALAEGLTIPLPSLQIGTFAMDDSVGHIKLVIHSGLQLLDRLGDAVNKLTAPFLAEESGNIDLSQPKGPPSGHNGVRSMMATVREREGQLMQAAARLQKCCQ